MRARIFDGFGLIPILLLACALRLVWVALCANEPTADQFIYHSAAIDLAEGRGYIDQSGNPANYWSVGFPALLAAAYGLFGAHYQIAFVVNLGLWLLAIGGMYRLGRAYYGRRAGQGTALMMALHPTFVLHTTLFASETPFLAGLPWALLALTRMVREPERCWRFALEAGLWIAALAYVRPTALLLLACPIAFGVLHRAPIRRTVLSGVVVSVVAFALLAPWGLRNLEHFGTFSVTSYNGGANLWMGNSEGSDGGYRELPPDVERLGLVERDALLKQRAFSFIRENPGRYVQLSLQRVAFSLRSDTIGAVWNRVGIERRFGEQGVLALKVVCSAAHWALLLGALVTLVRLGRRRVLSRADAEVLLVVGLMSVPFVLIVGGNRYMLPVVPMLTLWVASLRRGYDPVAASDRTSEPRVVGAVARSRTHVEPAAEFQLISKGLARKLALSFVIAALAYGALLLYAEVGSLASSVNELSVQVLLLATVIGAGNYVLRYWRWAYYLRLLRLQVRTVDSILVFLSGFAMSITPAKLGEVLKSILLRDAYDIAIARSAPIVVAERVTDVTGLLLLAGIGAWQLPAGPWIAIACFTGALLLALLVGSPRLGVLAIELATKLGKVRKLRTKLLDAHASLTEMLTPTALLVGTLVSVLAWGVQGAALALIARSYADVTLTVGAAMVAYCAPLLAGTLAMIPGGLGVTEASMTGVIQALGGIGATPAVAAAVTIVVRIITFWFAILLGFAALGAWYALHRPKSVPVYSSSPSTRSSA